MKAQCDKPELNDKLLLYLEKQLNGNDMKTLAAHIDGCSACRHEIIKLREIDAALSTHRTVLAEKYADSSCIDPDLLVAYANQREMLSDKGLKEIKQHLNSCTDCNRYFSQLLDLEQDMQKMTFHKEPVDGLHSFLKAVSREYPLSKSTDTSLSTQMIHLTKSILQKCRDFVAELFIPQSEPQLIMVRKGKRKLQENISIIMDRSGGIELKIEIEELEKQKFEVLVFLSTSGLRSSLDNIRVSLFHDTLEIVSLFLEDGKALFKDISPGTYHIVLSRNRREIKRVQFLIQ